MTKKKFGGLALLGAAALGLLHLLTKKEQTDTTDLSGLGGGSALGTGGSTAIVPGTEKPSTTLVYGEDSVATGIEDDDNRKNYGAVDYPDSGASNIPANVVNKNDNTLMDIAGEVAPYAGLSVIGALSNSLLKKGSTASAGSVLGSLGAGTVAGTALKVVSRTVPAIGALSLASDVLVGRAGDGGGGVPITDGSPTVASVLGESVSGIPDTKMDYVGATTPTPSQKDEDSLTKALNIISNSPPGTTWEQVYSSTKTGDSRSKGITSVGYKGSSGSGAAFAGISAEDYAAYLTEKRAGKK